MKNQSIKPQNSIETASRALGSGLVPPLEEKEKVEKKKDIPTTRKRDRFDKEGHPLIRQGHQFRKDHLKIYKIHAALKGVSQQELINNALEYYKVTVLQKSEAKKLKEAGQEELEV